ASVFDVSPIIGAIALAVSKVGGELMLLVVSLLVVSEFVERSVPFPQDVKTPVITTIDKNFFIMNFFYPKQQIVNRIMQGLKSVVIAYQKAAHKNVYRLIYAMR